MVVLVMAYNILDEMTIYPRSLDPIYKSRLFGLSVTTGVAARIYVQEVVTHFIK